MIGAPIEEEEEEDKVVALLASLSGKFKMLVTALEANTESKTENHKTNVVTAESNSERLGLMTQVLADCVCINDVWVIDSGATCHRTNDRSLLRDRRW